MNSLRVNCLKSLRTQRGLALPLPQPLSWASASTTTIPLRWLSTTPVPRLRPNERDSLARPVPEPTAVERQDLATSPEVPSRVGAKKILPEFNLDGRVVLVSGGARGLGLTQAEGLLEAGATVYALDRIDHPDPEFEKISGRAVTELGTSLHYRRVDVTDVAGLGKTVAEISAKHGRLDGLIAAAGINKEGNALEYTAADFDWIMQVNVIGVFSTAQAAAREMVKYGNGGSIVLIASMSATIANKLLTVYKGLICAAYNSSKAAVVQLARNLASEWGQHGIRVNSISPGYIVTPMTRHDFKASPEREQFLSEGNMLGRLSLPEEYRGAGVFLVSNASSFMTGSDLLIDGGHHAW
ncbi:NAD(P)-binding protein [Choiromyces venosus 120613-1]|uniref:NAD(P)-binding protein n=1 Tax=Choiromyces venosus 120613-1 TaxID=1336337 RepID=A0A3N4JJ91_9PEZI|nr:NAD(P)-binding protein [Choiromyces venosus 120613-1]